MTGQVQHTRPREQIVGDVIGIQLAVGAALGEHGALIALDDDDDRARRQCGMRAKVRGYSRLLEKTGVPREVVLADDSDEIDRGTE